MTRVPSIAAGLMAAGMAFAAQAAKLPLYDGFSGETFDRAKWAETESWRFVDAGKAWLGRWIYGGTSSDTGVVAETFALNLTATAPPKGFAATIKVTDLFTNEGCNANTTPSRPRARIIAAYFNVRPGGPVPGDRTGDILALMQLQRASNSADPPDVLRVGGYVVECTNADCSASTIRYSADLGTTTVNTAVVSQIDWDKKNNLFRFTRDKATSIETPYTENDSVAPSVPLANLSLRNEAANCMSGPRTKSGLAAQYDNVLLAP